METEQDQQYAADQRTLRIVWLAITMGVVMISVVFVFLLRSGSGGTSAESSNLFFSLNVVVSILATLGGFYIQRNLDDRLASMSSFGEAMGAIRTACILSIAIVEASAIFAAVAAFVTGDLMNLAFVVPFFAFAWLFFPSGSRFAYWKALTGQDS